MALLKVKCIGQFTLKSVIDSWGLHSDENITFAAILSFDAGSPVIIISNKYKESIVV